MNTSYRHFFLFINEVCLLASTLPRAEVSPQFKLVDQKELVPLDELNEAILAEDARR